MFPISRCGIPLTLIALAGLASSASAQIVKDGGFETADPGQKTQTDYFNAGTPFDAHWVITGEVGIDSKDAYVYDGKKSLDLNYGLGTDSISQNLATKPVDFYTLSFYADDDTPGDLLTVSFGGTTFAPIAVPANGYAGPPDSANSGLFTLYSFSGLTTTSPFTGLSFSTNSQLGSTLELDDITVTSSPVPEASTSLSLGLLLLLGLGGAAWTAKKKAAVKATSTIA